MHMPPMLKHVPPETHKGAGVDDHCAVAQQQLLQPAGPGVALHIQQVSAEAIIGHDY